MVTRSTYHHGDLRAALIAAALEIVEEVGPDAFSLRAAARLAGVSPAAPAHHFGDARGLLTAIATIGFLQLGDALATVAERDRRSAIVAHCHVYLQFALARPGLFRLMWRKEVLNIDDADHIAAAKRAFILSDRVVRGDDAIMRSHEGLALAPTIACWSLVHGFATLVIDGAFFGRRTDPSQALDALLDATLTHLNIG